MRATGLLGGGKVPEENQAVHWERGNIPPLHTDLWYRAKWNDKIGNIYRAQIYRFGLVRSNWNSVVRADFAYDLQLYRKDLKKWVSM